MPAAADRSAVAQEWLSRAEDDLVIGRHALTLGAACPTAAVCYHAQQCVEKSLKAMLVAEGRAFPFVHDLRRLRGLLREGTGPDLDESDEERLTLYETAGRYPGFEIPDLAQAESAIALAAQVLAWATKSLEAPSDTAT